ncbi:unnamed protein product [Parajaminaea phylloscopi]
MPPKKGNKMSLNDFLADETTGKTSWADDMDDLPLAPAPRDDRYGLARRGGDYLASVPDRAERDRMMADRGGLGGGFGGAPRMDIPLPDKPPYTAFLGSLSYDVTEDELADFFAPHKAVSVRIVADRDGKPKGFGYIEFEQLDGLKEALDRSGGNVAGRSIRVGVAEPPKSSDRGGFPPSVAEEASQWRRAGPLPPAPDSGFGGAPRPGMGRERSSGFGAPRADGPSGFDTMDVSAGGRSGFGSRFQATPAARDGPPLARGPRAAPAEPLEPSKGETASDWRTGKPVEAPPRRAGGFGSGYEAAGASSSRGPRPVDAATDVDEKYSSQERMGFGSKFSPTPPESPAMTSRGPRGANERRTGPVAPAPAGPSDSADTWRSARATPASGSPSSEARSPAAPAERKKLDLKPRTAASATDGAGAGASASTSSNKASPFGTARPVDVQEKERAIEERLQKERAQRASDEKAKQDKVKAERENALKDAPRGPRADREKPAADAPSPSPSAAPAAAPASQATATTGDEGAAPATEAPKVKSPPPTGAWGGGRKASGALLGGKPGSSTDAGATNGSAAAVDAAAEGVAQVSVSEKAE